jgi:uncharacterized membrane protein YsdA (DUF1294 family)
MIAIVLLEENHCAAMILILTCFELSVYLVDHKEARNGRYPILERHYFEVRLKNK